MHSSPGVSDAARLAIHEAQLAAQDLGHGLVDTEHLLLGLIRKTPETFEGHCQPLELQEAVERLTRHGRTEGVEEELPVTEGSKKALQLAMRMATEGDGGEVRPDHLVVALILVDEGTAASALSQVGIDSQEAWESAPPLDSET